MNTCALCVNPPFYEPDFNLVKETISSSFSFGAAAAAYRRSHSREKHTIFPIHNAQQSDARKEKSYLIQFSFNIREEETDAFCVTSCSPCVLLCLSSLARLSSLLKLLHLIKKTFSDSLIVFSLLFFFYSCYGGGFFCLIFSTYFH